nr:hypothetical protein Iba_chr05bCG6660 [Ipomoea batatas]
MSCCQPQSDAAPTGICCGSPERAVTFQKNYDRMDSFAAADRKSPNGLCSLVIFRSENTMMPSSNSNVDVSKLTSLSDTDMPTLSQSLFPSHCPPLPGLSIRALSSYLGNSNSVSPPTLSVPAAPLSSHDADVHVDLSPNSNTDPQSELPENSHSQVVLPENSLSQIEGQSNSHSLAPQEVPNLPSTSTNSSPSPSAAGQPNLSSSSSPHRPSLL